MIDEFELHMVPVLLARGERLFDCDDVGQAGDRQVELVSSLSVANDVFARS